ncbi:MAG TPA: tripartite tricarboxylate transporter substrate binding protein, partial [Firmicutes bacterium]|nr:tripartite tricarboxylate transporter substrate binding protein [Bacillota bacterium]
DQFVRTQSSKKMGLWGAEAKTLALKMESVASWMSYELGLAKKTPTELGIAPLE